MQVVTPIDSCVCEYCDQMNNSTKITILLPKTNSKINLCSKFCFYKYMEMLEEMNCTRKKLSPEKIGDQRRKA